MAQICSFHPLVLTFPTTERKRQKVIEITVNNTSVAAEKGKSLLRAILKAKLPIATSCGGQGSCHLCRLTILQSDQELSQPNEIEMKALGNVCIQSGMRLACQITVNAPMQVDVPPLRKKRKKH